MRHRIATFVVAVCTVTGLTSLAPTVADAATHISTRYLLNHLTVKGEHTSGYERSKFAGWTDADHDGCDTRDEVLIKEAVIAPHVGSSCTLTGGKWRSRYDGLVTTDPSTFDIDHMVPLAEAWQSGAYRWTSSTRARYANDLGYAPDLVAVSAHSNRSKGEQEPQAWLPGRASYRCTYMANWVAAKWRWHLTINGAEQTFLHNHLSACGWPSVVKPSRPAISTTTTSTSGSGGTTATHTCTKTSSGSCIRRGEFCPQADYGKTGYDANGEQLTCTGDTTHPRWE